MRPILLRWGRITLPSYTALLYLGILFGLYAELRAAALSGLDVARTLAATVLLIGAALLGARLLFVALHWPRFRAAPRRILRASEGGAAMYGGLLVAVPLSIPLLGGLGLRFAAFWDVASFTMLVGMIFTRIGCFLHGCCAGRPTSGWFALNLPGCRGVRERRIPTQILESAWAVLVLAGAVIGWSHRPFVGALFAYTVGAYSIGRVALESLRETQDRVRGLSLNRALSTAFVCVALGAFAIAARR